MASVTLAIGGRSHVVACRDGEEAVLEALGARLDAHSEAAIRAAGGSGGERSMLFVALMLADDLVEAEKAKSAGSPAIDASALAALAARLESLADRVEKSLPNA